MPSINMLINVKYRLNIQMRFIQQTRKWKNIKTGITEHYSPMVEEEGPRPKPHTTGFGRCLDIDWSAVNDVWRSLVGAELKV